MKRLFYHLAFEPVVKLSFCRFWNSFELFFDRLKGDNIRKWIFSPFRRSKNSQNNPQNRRSLSFATGSFFFAFVSGFADTAVSSRSMEQELAWQNELRAKALESLDAMLFYTFDGKGKVFCLQKPLVQEAFQVESPKILEFIKLYNYFSDKHPLIAKVTEEPEDIVLACQLLEEVHRKIKIKEQRILAASEILAKVLAYRDLKVGTRIPIPANSETEDPLLLFYKVDQIFDLWHGMPAFGLLPEQIGSGAPILLYRGTDLSFITVRGWASIISDLDIKGPGLSAFLSTREKLGMWLKKAFEINRKKARAIGFSLGGVLTAYTAIFEPDYLTQSSKEPSMAFNLPGISEELVKKWRKEIAGPRPALTLFVTEGDVISKVGKLIGEGYEFSVGRELMPVSAHVTLMSAQPLLYLRLLDISEENQRR
ncbi:MAG: hypothetical protein ACM3JI_00570 [Anaerolineae bacterium]